MRMLLAVILFVFSTAYADDNHLNNLKEARNADLTGVWSMGNGYMILYPDQRMKTLGTDCSIIGTGTWKFEYGALTVYEGGKEVMWTYIIEFKAGQKMVLSTKREWLFISKNTGMEC